MPGRPNARTPGSTGRPVAFVDGILARIGALIGGLAMAVMGLEDTIKASAKTVEGRLQGAAGDLSGDQQMKVEGQAKQAQAHRMEAAGSPKDKVRQAAEAVGDAIDDLTGKAT
jgi:uncharacterized protein YjbJ (UPF0337 family)